MAQQQEISWFRTDAPRRSDALSEPKPKLGSSAASGAAASSWPVTFSPVWLTTSAVAPRRSRSTRKFASRKIPTSLWYWSRQQHRLRRRSPQLSKAPLTLVRRLAWWPMGSETTGALLTAQLQKEQPRSERKGRNS